MSYNVNPGAVSGVLQQVAPLLEEYQAEFTAVGEKISELATACMAEPVAAELGALTEKLINPAFTNIAGRSSNAVNAVNNVLTILLESDAQMADDAREASMRAAQGAADNPPQAPEPAVHSRSGPQAV
ncbi:DUF6507 family protein [Arthrobacter caoxuetaonis]|uniref:DUF6507 family protein n=1 Tax=Arthrobacter caoxuetaonis TaxID=2886935 RepID=UPI001D13DCEF|nr:DUF6507 family protein [Arthrobacter caoxuetaonis]